MYDEDAVQPLSKYLPGIVYHQGDADFLIVAEAVQELRS